MVFPHFWEPEETVGSAWHGMSHRWDAEPSHDGAAVAYEDIAAVVGVLHRALCQAEGADISASAGARAKSRVSGRAKLGREADDVTRASYDGAKLALPRRIALFESAELNRDLYLWLAALSACVQTPFQRPDGALATDLAMLRAMIPAERALLRRFPGLRRKREALGLACLSLRPKAKLPPVEAALEGAIRALLTGQSPSPDAERFTTAILAEGFAPADHPTPQGYKPFRPVALWPLLAPPRLGEKGRAEEDAGGGAPSQGSDKTLRARRHEADQAERKDSLLLYRFESILSWAEFLNINRATEDEEEDNARRAANDLEEVSIANISRKARKKLLFHLDLAPREVDPERLIGESTYPEWDWKRGAYLPDHVRVEERLAEEKDPAEFDRASARRRIERVRRQFEALRPKRRVLKRQVDGFDLDLDEVVRARCDLISSGECAERVYQASRNEERDLAALVLIDVSRSTESSVSGRPVIEIAREALIALVGGMEACGDQVEVLAFSSLRRERVMIERVKTFDEPNDLSVRRRAAGLSPRHYTRLGAAIRHASRRLAARASQRRLLLIITDGKPNDLDHYDGRHGVEDTRRAAQEARRLGQAVFAVAIDAKAQEYLPHLFGPGGYAVIPDAEKLVDALPDLYRHVAG